MCHNPRICLYNLRMITNRHKRGSSLEIPDLAGEPLPLTH